MTLDEAMKTIEERFLKTSDTKVADDTALCNNALAEKEHQPVVLVNKVDDASAPLAAELEKAIAGAAPVVQVALRT